MKKPTKAILCVISYDDDATVIEVEHTAPSVRHLVEEIRTAIKAWGETEEGREYAESNSGDFNWGDFVELYCGEYTLHVGQPEIPCIQSVRFLSDGIETIRLPHDEKLMNLDDW